MWVKQILLAIVGLSGGVVVSAGLFALIVEIGVISDFADRTHTADHILLYEDCTALGGILGNLIFLFKWPIPFQTVALPLFGLLSGVFVGCWAMGLAEILNVFPIFIRRIKIVRYTTAFVISIAVGRGAGALLYFAQGW